jgi:hypothetical protein
MKALFGAIVVAGSGKVGGHVFTKNRGGAVMRTKVSPANAQTPRQSAVRNLFTTLSQAWKDLTQAQRDGWNAAVSNYARTDLFGSLRMPSGLNLFQRLNNVIMNCGGSMITTAPLPGFVPEVTISAFTATVGTPSMSVTFNGPVVEDCAIIAFATAPMSAGRSYVKSDYRQIKIIQPAASSPENLLSAYVAKFGNTGAVGQKIFVKFVSANLITGQTSTGSVASVITVA